MLLALHIVAVGSVVGVTAYIAYYLGEKDGLNYAEKEQGKGGNIKISSEFEKNSNTFEIITRLQIIQTYLDCCCMRKQLFFFRKANNLLSLALQTFCRITDNRTCFHKVLNTKW